MTQGNGLSDAYTATLTRLKTQKGNKSALGLKVLMWVLYSERPLKTKVLCHALGVELGSTDLDHENIPALQTLLASSLGLVTVEASSSTVRFVHFTLQEHLLSDATLFHRPHSIIAEVSLTYLNFQCVQDLSPKLKFAPAIMPLLEYASYYWGEHTRKGMTENVKMLALRLLDKFDEHISAQLLLLRYNRHKRPFAPDFDFPKGPIGFTGLHGAAFLGIVEILEALLEIKEWDVNAEDNAWCTPLIWAVVRGHEEVVKMLLEQGDVNPDLAGYSNFTPLSWAVRLEHEGVVKVFLERDGVNSNQASPKYAQESLISAAEYGREGIVKMLLEREDVNPNIADTCSGLTPLWSAAANGREQIVKMLLDRNDVRIDIQDHNNRFAHSWALLMGHHKIARMISERAAMESDTADPGSQEPLPSSARDEEDSMDEIKLGENHPNSTTANPCGNQHPHQQTPIRRKGIGLRRLFFRFRR